MQCILSQTTYNIVQKINQAVARVGKYDACLLNTAL